MPYLELNDEIIFLFYNLYDVSNGCYYGGIESFENLGKYTSWTEDPWQILKNFGYNFGYVYNNVRDILLSILNIDRSPLDSAYSIGVALGQIYYFILIVEYFYQAVETVAPENIDFNYSYTGSLEDSFLPDAPSWTAYDQQL